MNNLKSFGLGVLQIPDELKTTMTWGVSTLKVVDPESGRKDKAPRNPRTGELISVTSDEGWATFDEAVSAGYPAIGMRLTANDQYTVIDLDKAKSEEDNLKARQVYDAFDSYTEKSQSGSGVHIILKGPNEAGRRRNNVEIYSQDRYVICTGEILKNRPIIDGGKPLERLKKNLDFSDNPDTLPVIKYEDEKETDSQIIQKMFNANNGAKVKLLYNTIPSPSDDWSTLDAQLAQHISFYTKNPAQALRIFRGSKLYRPGKKRGYENVKRYEEDYLIRRTFNRAWALEESRRIEQEKTYETISKMVKKNAVQEKQVEDGKFATLEDKPLPDIEFPTGLIGLTARYIYQTAPRPVKEVAIAGAFAMLSGIVGRHYNINGSGLGLYTVLLAKTGRGKEAANSGVSLLMDEVAKNIPSAYLFRGPSQIASGQGLIRAMSEGEDDENIPSKFVILSEFGHTLNIICAREATAADMRTRQALLDFFSKNSWGSVIKESAYSDKSNNTKEIKSANLSILGDTTPEVFFKSVSMDIVNEGFMPRFMIIEYDGPRVPSNYNINRTPETDLVTRWQTLISQVVSLRDTNECINIQMSDEAQELLGSFDTYCDEKINKGDEVAECWNRAHLQALRVAGNIAVGNNFFMPIVEKEDAEYAIALVKRSVLSLEKRLSTGAYGGGEFQQEYEIRKEVHKYFNMKPEEKRNAGVAKEHIESGFLPMQYIVSTCAQKAIFSKSSRGAMMTIANAINSLIQQGDIDEVDAREIYKGDRKVTIRTGRLFTKGMSYDMNWDKQLKSVNEGI